ncbi:MAG TPA: YraN family protein [Cellvibrio sp.]|nr:YraN family protein [Cellvibrio sp.]
MFFLRRDKSSPQVPRQNQRLSSGNGAAAEAQAEHFLQQQGLITLEKNYRTRQGEIDLIMRHNDELVFVEVRLRQHRQFANAAESVTMAKQKKLIKTAAYYLQQQKLSEKANCRFDVIAFAESNQPPEWIKNAFSAY